MKELKSRIGDRELYNAVKGGEVVFVSSKDYISLKGVTACVLVDAPPQKVWKLISSYEDYPALIWLVNKASVLSKKASEKVVRFGCGFRFLIIQLGVEFTLRLKEKATERIDFELVEGELDKLSGYWEFRSVEGGKKTILIYSMESEVRSLGRFARFLLNKYPVFEPILQSVITQLVVRIVKEKAEAEAEVS